MTTALFPSADKSCGITLAPASELFAALKTCCEDFSVSEIADCGLVATSYVPAGVLEASDDPAASYDRGGGTKTEAAADLPRLLTELGALGLPSADIDAVRYLSELCTFAAAIKTAKSRSTRASDYSNTTAAEAVGANAQGSEVDGGPVKADPPPEQYVPPVLPAVVDPLREPWCVVLSAVESKETRKAIHATVAARLPQFATDTLPETTCIRLRPVGRARNLVRNTVSRSATDGVPDCAVLASIPAAWLNRGDDGAANVGEPGEEGPTADGGGGGRAASFDKRCRSAPWPRAVPPVLLFKLVKRNINSATAERLVNSALHLPPGAVVFAGTKDTAAVTAQWATALRVTARTVSMTSRERPDSTQHACGTTKGHLAMVPVGYLSEPLRLGALSGNMFRIVLRDVAPARAFGASLGTTAKLLGMIHERCTALQREGFVNFFGPQRFSPAVLPSEEEPAIPASAAEAVPPDGGRRDPSPSWYSSTVRVGTALVQQDWLSATIHLLEQVAPAGTTMPRIVRDSEGAFRLSNAPSNLPTSRIFSGGTGESVARQKRGESSPGYNRCVALHISSAALRRAAEMARNCPSVVQTSGAPAGGASACQCRQAVTDLVDAIEYSLRVLGRNFACSSETAVLRMLKHELHLSVKAADARSSPAGFYCVGARFLAESKGPSTTWEKGGPEPRAKAPRHYGADHVHHQLMDHQGGAADDETTVVHWQRCLLKALPRKMITLYLHSLQSFAWNCAASARVQCGRRVMVGDLVAVKSPQREGGNESGNSQSNFWWSKGGSQKRGALRGGRGRGSRGCGASSGVDSLLLPTAKNIPRVFLSDSQVQEVRAVQSVQEAALFTLEDVVLPLPGFTGSNFAYPSVSCCTMEAFKEFFTSIDCPFFSSPIPREYNCYGGYRRVFVRAESLTWAVALSPAAATLRPALYDLWEKGSERRAAALGNGNATAPPTSMSESLLPIPVGSYEVHSRSLSDAATPIDVATQVVGSGPYPEECKPATTLVSNNLDAVSLLLQFSLPSSAYATSLMRNIAVAEVVAVADNGEGSDEPLDD